MAPDFLPTFGRLALGAAFLLFATSFASAQTAEPPAADPPPPPAARTNPLPGPTDVFSSIGRFIDRSITSVGEGMKGAGEALGGATAAATDAAGTIARLPGTNIVKGWERCATAPNGAPDCEVASLALCKTKGFERGRSLDITSSYKCPAQLWREGRQPNDAECRNEAHVSQAVCQ
jgi:hypothetical protein